MSTEPFETIIRRAEKADLPALGHLGALLLRNHYAYDARRFLAPGDDPENGYAWFLGTQLEEKDVAVFVAEQRGAVIGYVYAGVEPQSWRELVVEESARRMGVATRLVEAAAAWLAERGMPRVVLWTAERNGDARRLFEGIGFRRTMVEMTREL